MCDLPAGVVVRPLSMTPKLEDAIHSHVMQTSSSTSVLPLRQPPSGDEMDCSEIVTVTPSTHALSDHAAFFSGLHEPFSWKQNVDWELISQNIVWPPHMDDLNSSFSIDFDAGFFPNEQKLGTVVEAGRNVAFSIGIIATLVNNMCHAQPSIVSDPLTWLGTLLRPDVMQCLKALPGEIFNVLEERVFATALRAGDLHTVEFMLALDMRLYERLMVSWPSQSAPSYPFEIALDGGHLSVAKAIITHSCQHMMPFELDELLSQLLNWWESASEDEQELEKCANHVQGSEIVDLLCIVLSAGAVPESRCIAAIDGDFVLAKQLFQAAGLERIAFWLQAGLVEECFQQLRTRKMEEWLAEKIMRYIFKENRKWLPIGDSILEATLWRALQAAVQAQRMWATERILMAIQALGYHSDFDINLENEDGDSFFRACRDGDWALAFLLMPTQMPTTMTLAHDVATLASPMCKGVIELREAHCAQILEENDIHGVYELLDGTKEEDWEWVEEKCSDAIDLGLDQMVVAFMQRLSFTEEWQPTQRQFNSLLTQGRTTTVSALLRSDPRWKTALKAASDTGDFDALVNVIYPTISCNAWFVYDEPIVQQQMSLRALAYDACERKDYDLFKWLLDCGIDTDELVLNEHKDPKTSEIHNYLSKRPDTKGGLGGQSWQHVNTHSQVWPSLLAVAVCQNDELWMQFLLSEGVESRDSMALLHAVKSNASAATISMLLEVADGQKRWDKRTYGSAALREAIKQQNLELVDILCRNVDIDKIESSTEDTLKSEQALSPLGEAILTGNIDIVRVLLQNSANANTCITYDGLRSGKHATSFLPRVSPLLGAIAAQNLPIVQLLVSHGAEIDYKRPIGLLRTPLQRAAEIGDLAIVQYLVEQGAIIDTPPMNCGGTALQLAAMTGYVGIVSFLLERGAEPNYPPADGDGRTAFEAAAEWCRIDVMLLLMKWGVQLDLVLGKEHESQYRRAIRFAAANGFPAAARFVRHLYEGAPDSLSMEDAQALGLAERSE
jgi:ankyrin repeat protein